MLAAALAPLQPLRRRPLLGRGWAIVSASPELFLARRGDRLVTRPIKGTRPAGVEIDDEKDAAEHVMIVDLERNDLSRVCDPGSVAWPELMVQHELAGVTHLVSTVTGRARAGARPAEVLAALFPGGSVTGAPKIAAVDLIAALEPVGRGASMGALGVLRPNGDFELALTIRTFAVAAGRVHLWVGGGIVWDSEPEAEIEESWVKARPLLDRAACAGGGVSPLLAAAVAGRGLVEPATPVFYADDEALLRGAAAFETVRIRHGAAVLLAGHVERFEALLALPAPSAAGGRRRACAGGGRRGGDRRGRAAPLPDDPDAARDGGRRCRPGWRRCGPAGSRW